MTGWILSTIVIYYLIFGDSITNSGIFFLGANKGAISDHSQIRVAIPPDVNPKPVESYTYSCAF